MEQIRKMIGPVRRDPREEIVSVKSLIPNNTPQGKQIRQKLDNASNRLMKINDPKKLIEFDLLLQELREARREGNAVQVLHLSTELVKLA